MKTPPLLYLACFGVLCAANTASLNGATPRLRISDNHRFIVQEDGRPFFYLGDTAWELFHCLTREEADLYLRTRADQGFTVIQAVVLAEFDGLRLPNAYGHLPLRNDDPMQPVEEYFQHVDWITKRANELGLWVGMLPTWGDKWNLRWGKGPVIFTPENARPYGEWLARRYRDANIIWILGGDRAIENDQQGEIIRAMAAGLRAGDGGRHLITFHPMGGKHSADMMHDEPWLDFNMIQSGHAEKNIANYDKIARDYARTPTKPCMDAEPCYENHPVRRKREQGCFDDWDVRKLCYWALFAGAHGHSYGCHDIWSFHDPAKPEGWAWRAHPFRASNNINGIDQRHGVWSCTKSFTSNVLGLLIEDGKCMLDTRVADVLPEFTAHYPHVTLRHFTTMTSGYRAVGDKTAGSLSARSGLPRRPVFRFPRRFPGRIRKAKSMGGASMD